MRIKTEFPNAICEVAHFWIPLSDGCRLAARRWLPVDAAEHRVPALLYFTPYRLSDSTLPGLTLDQPYGRRARHPRSTRGNADVRVRPAVGHVDGPPVRRGAVCR